MQGSQNQADTNGNMIISSNNTEMIQWPSYRDGEDEEIVNGGGDNCDDDPCRWFVYT